MRMLMATRVAAVAVGLSLVSGMALATPDGRRGNNENAVAEDQKRGDQDARDRSKRGTKPVVNPAPAASPTYPGMPDGAVRNERRRGVERARNRSEGVRNASGRNNQVSDRVPDKRGHFGDRNDRRGWGDRAQEYRRDSGDRNDRHAGGDRNARQHINIQQHYRNFNSPRSYRAEVYRWRDGSSYRRYGYGQRLPQHYFIRNFWIANFFSYDLFAPPPGYIWVRYGPDALLVDQYTGEIVQVRYGVFYS